MLSPIKWWGYRTFPISPLGIVGSPTQSWIKSLENRYSALFLRVRNCFPLPRLQLELPISFCLYHGTLCPAEKTSNSFRESPPKNNQRTPGEGRKYGLISCHRILEALKLRRATQSMSALGSLGSNHMQEVPEHSRCAGQPFSEGLFAGADPIPPTPPTLRWPLHTQPFGSCSAYLPPGCKPAVLNPTATNPGWADIRKHFANCPKALKPPRNCWLLVRSPLLLWLPHPSPRH